MQKHTITYEGVKVEYDAQAIRSWPVQKKVAKGGYDAFEAIDMILCGKSDEVAEKFDNDTDRMAGLITAISSLDPEAKN